MKILVINAGSSSLKYQLFNMEDASVLAKGLCERIGAGGEITHKKTGATPFSEELDLPNHGVALERVLALLTSAEYGVITSIDEIDAVGHRVAHGGEKLKESSRVTESVIAYLETIVPISARLICNISSMKFKADTINAIRESLDKQVRQKA